MERDFWASLETARPVLRAACAALLGLYTLGQYPEALAVLSEWAGAELRRRASLARRDARGEVSKVLALDPGFTIERVAESTAGTIGGLVRVIRD